jgi:hypothetical protein
VRAYCQAQGRRGGDHAAGRKLYSYFLDVGITDPQVALVTRPHTVGEGKTLALSTLEASAPAILAEGVATEDELNTARDSLAEFTADPRSLIVGPRIFQLWARR